MVIDWLVQKQLGWISSYIDNTGCKSVKILTDVLWYPDGCSKSLEGPQAFRPHIFSYFSDCNKPESYGHKRVPMQAMTLCTLQ